jgi:large subunit ribosomal protein L24
MKIKKGDQVKIISGKDRGKSGKVLRCLPEENKVVVDGINIVKRHKKSNRRGQKGERIMLPIAINVSNAQLVCPQCGKTSRLGWKIIDKGKIRFCKKCGKEI